MDLSFLTPAEKAYYAIRRRSKLSGFMLGLFLGPLGGLAYGGTGIAYAIIGCLLVSWTLGIGLLVLWPLSIIVLPLMAMNENSKLITQIIYDRARNVERAAAFPTPTS